MDNDENLNDQDQESQGQKSSNSNIFKNIAKDHISGKARRAAGQLARRAGRKAGEGAERFAINLGRQAAMAAVRAVGTLVLEAVIAFLPWILAILGAVVLIIFIIYSLSGSSSSPKTDTTGNGGSFGGAGASSCWYSNNPSGDTSNSTNPVCDTKTASASAGTCNGKYAASIKKNWLYPRNYGDPACDFSKQAVNEQLSQQDPSRANFWMAVIQCESGYNPNAWLDPNGRPNGVCTPDAGGAFGLFQDGSSTIMNPLSLYTRGNPCGRGQVGPGNVAQPPGAPTGWGHGGPYDRGDVSWKTQVQYAIQLLNIRGKGYWACAKGR